MATSSTAGDCFPDPDICKITNGWFLEYICNTVWQEFKETHQVQSASRDFVQGILYRDIDKTPHHICRIHFLLIICKLVDGEEYGTQYTEESVLTVLEEVAISFDSLVQLMHGYPDILHKSSQFRTLILKQAVYVCCRAGDTEIAEGVVERQWTDVEESALEDQKEVLEVLRSEQDQHKALIRNSYDSFINKLIGFLDELFNCLPEPFIFKIAKNVARIPSCDSDRQIIKSKYFKDGHRLQRDKITRKLECIRTQTVKDLATFDTERITPDNLTELQLMELNENDVDDAVDSDEMSSKFSDRQIRKMSKKRRLSVLTRMIDKNRKDLKKAIDKYSKHFPLTPRFKSPQTTRSSLKKTAVSESPGTVHNSSSSELELSDLDCDKRPAHLFQIQGQHRIRTDLRYPSLNSTTNYGMRINWTEEEEDLFYLTVQKFGVGKWATIRSDLETRRTNVNLKDKWRQWLKGGRMKQLIKKHGPVKKVTEK